MKASASVSDDRTYAWLLVILMKNSDEVGYRQHTCKTIQMNERKVSEAEKTIICLSQLKKSISVASENKELNGATKERNNTGISVYLYFISMMYLY